MLYTIMQNIPNKTVKIHIQEQPTKRLQKQNTTTTNKNVMYTMRDIGNLTNRHEPPLNRK